MSIFMKFLIPLILLLNQFSHAEEINNFKSVFSEFPETTKYVLEKSFTKESWKYWGIITASTLILYKYDEEIYAEMQRVGRKIGIGNDDDTRPSISYKGFNILRTPRDIGGLLYFFGDGWFHFGIASTFLVNGDGPQSRATKTGYQIMHGMFASTIPNQILKRLTGRESPFVKTKKRGAWRAFPSFQDYGDNTPKYDAFPTGHLMTATMTYTVIDNNYPEYRHIIRPIGITMLALLGFEMVNNGVHWASDYPLGIAMGYMYGKAASRVQSQQVTSKPKLEYYPILSSQVYGVAAMSTF